MIKITHFLFYTNLILILITGCSGKGNPSAPDTVGDPPVPLELTGTREISDYDGSHFPLFHNLIYMNVTDPENVEYEIVPLREGFLHLNILKFLEFFPCTDCFEIVGFSYPEPGVINVDFKITHPFDDPLYTIFDVRGIMMFDGSHAFPVSGMTIPNRWLGDGEFLNPDGFTSLYNTWLIGPAPPIQEYFQGVYASDILPNALVNGYIRHISDDPSNTRNALLTGDSVTRTYSLKYPANEFVFGYAVDASWAPPLETPVDDPMTDFGPNANSPEPWKIVVIPFSENLTDEGGTSWLQIDVYDYGGKDTYETPVIECSELFNGEKIAGFKSETDDLSRYHVALANENLATGGYYKCLITVQDNDYNPNFPWIDMKAFQVTDVRVEGKPVAVAGADPNPQYMNIPIYFWSYTSYDADGGEIVLHEWDWDNDGVYDETGPEAMHSFDTVGYHPVQCRVTDDEGKTDELDEPLEILISGLNPLPNPVEITPYWMKISPSGVCMVGDNAYITADTDSLHIYDLSDKNNPVLLNSLMLSEGGSDGTYVSDIIAVSDGYAYIPLRSYQSDIRIIDIDPPEQAYIVNTIGLKPASIFDLEVKDGYLYVGSQHMIRIVDIDPPESAHGVFKHEMTEYSYQTYDWDLGWEWHTGVGIANDTAIIGDYAYVVEFHKYLQHTSMIHMINIESPENAECVAEIDFNARNLDVYENYLVIAGEDPLGDLTVWDVNENVLINSIDIQPSILDEDTRMWIDPYGVAGLWENQSCILVDLDPILETHGADVITSDCVNVNVDGNNGTACMVESTSIKVWDTEIPDSAYMTAELDFIDDCYEIEVSGEYIFVESNRSTNENSQIAIIDIVPLESAHLVSEITIDGKVKSIEYFNNQLFVVFNVDWEPNHLQVFDVSSPENPVHVKYIEIHYTNEIQIVDGYLYSSGSLLTIYDIDPLEEVYEVNSIEGVFRPVISNGYAYCSGSSSLMVVDIDPPETAHLVNEIDLGQSNQCATISGNYLYVIGSLSWEYTLLVFNLDSPEEPVLVHSLPFERSWDFISSGNLAYSVRDHGFSILDISIPESTYVIEEVDTFGRTKSAEIQGDKFFLTMEFGVQVFDLW